MIRRVFSAAVNFPNCTHRVKYQLFLVLHR
nr:MAG TPA: hypothetical protein [Bacteriophage sp.]